MGFWGLSGLCKTIFLTHKPASIPFFGKLEGFFFPSHTRLHFNSLLTSKHTFKQPASQRHKTVISEQWSTESQKQLHVNVFCLFVYFFPLLQRSKMHAVIKKKKNAGMSEDENKVNLAFSKLNSSIN